MYSLKFKIGDIACRPKYPNATYQIIAIGGGIGIGHPDEFYYLSKCIESGVTMWYDSKEYDEKYSLKIN